jgi:Ca2+-binding RTX toxin-like protein
MKNLVRVLSICLLLNVAGFIVASTINGVPNQLLSVPTGEITGLATIATSGAITDATGTLLPAHGGTGLATIGAHGFMLGEGTGNVVTIVCGANTVPQGASSADPTCTASPSPMSRSPRISPLE